MCFSRVPLAAAPRTVARQTPLFMKFSSQECWSGLPCPPLGDLPDPGIKPVSLMPPALAAASLPRFQEQMVVGPTAHTHPSPAFEKP